MISRIDHVSIAVADYEKAEKFFIEVLGASGGLGGTDNSINFYWQVYSLGDLTRIELIKPSGEPSFLDNFMAERGGGVHHITMETPDIRKFKEFLDEKGVPYFGFQEERAEWKELFIHPKHAFGVLIQVAEFPPEVYLPMSHRLEAGVRWKIEHRQDGCSLVMKHVGGGKAEFNLRKDEIESLIRDLQEML